MKSSLNGMINRFNFQEEIDKYCSSDVKVLAMGVLKFRQIFYGQFDVDPFRYITISSLCLNLYLSKFMPSDTIVSNDATKPISKVSRQYFAFKNNSDILREHPLRISLTQLKGDRHKK